MLKKVYIKRQNIALQKKEDIIANLSSTPRKREQFNALKKAYNNERISDMVKNNNVAIRIVEYDGRLIQKIYPIFHEPSNPKHFLDFRTIFYSPTKHFAGKQIDTLWFNLAIIWTMTLLMVITLYFDVLRWIITGIGNFKFRKKSSVA